QQRQFPPCSARARGYNRRARESRAGKTESRKESLHPKGGGHEPEKESSPDCCPLLSPAGHLPRACRGAGARERGKAGGPDVGPGRAVHCRGQGKSASARVGDELRGG